MSKYYVAEISNTHSLCDLTYFFLLLKTHFILEVRGIGTLLSVIHFSENELVIKRWPEKESECLDDARIYDWV